MIVIDWLIDDDDWLLVAGTRDLLQLPYFFTGIKSLQKYTFDSYNKS